jgi:hypothetical protein
MGFTYEQEFSSTINIRDYASNLIDIFSNMKTYISSGINHMNVTNNPICIPGLIKFLYKLRKPSTYWFLVTFIFESNWCKLYLH